MDLALNTYSSALLKISVLYSLDQVVINFTLCTQNLKLCQVFTEVQVLMGHVFLLFHLHVECIPVLRLFVMSAITYICMCGDYQCVPFQKVAFVTMEEHVFILMCVNVLQAGQDQDVKRVSASIWPPARDMLCEVPVACI